MENPRRVIAAVDLSDISATVIRAAARIAARTEAGLLILHAMPPLADTGEGPLLPALRKLVGRAREDVFAALEHLRDEAGLPPGQDVEMELAEERADLAVLDAAKRHDAPLVVVGAPPPSVLLGVNLRRVARHARCPLLVVRRPPPEAGYVNLLAGTDFSPGAAAAVHAARPLAAEGAAWTFLHVFHESALGHLVEGRLAAIEEAGVRLDEWRRDVGKGLDAEAVVRSGEPRRLLPEEALARGSDLVVAGTHSRGKLHHLLIGTVAESAARHVPCDILLAPGETVEAEGP